MKKTVLFLAVLFTVFAHKTFAQCVPDSNLTYNGISPESLPDAMAGYYYSSVLSFKIPKDSSISGVNVTIDSARFLYATGKPPGFDFNCNTPNCVWPGGSKGCALFFGMVDSTFTDSVVKYPMKIYTLTWYRFTGGADQFQRIDSATNFSFKIVKYSGIAENRPYERLKAYPNPTNGNVTIELRDNTREPAAIKIMDAFGKLIREISIAADNQLLRSVSVDLSDCKPGLYFITVQSGDRTGLSKVMLR